MQTKKDILKAFDAFFTASGQSSTDKETNLKDLSRMSVNRLNKLRGNFNI